MKKLILKYLTNNISDKELTKLRDWLNKPKNEETFKAYIKDNYNLNGLYENVDTEAAFIKVWNKAQKQTKIIPLYKRNFFKYAVAASVVLLVSLTFLFNQGNTEGDIVVPVIVNNNIETGTDKAVLTLDDGTNVTLEKGQDYIADNIISNGEEIVYSDISPAKAEIAYNYLTIPRGGQYYIKLADGTEVWLNSESQIKYPVKFIDGETRAVELVYGEAYFDVSHSTNHKGSKFTVLTGNQEIEVLGTEFNVKAYQDEDFIYSTLVEGKIALKTETGKNLLAPNQQTILNKINNKIEVATVGDVYSITSWRKGVFSFKDMPLNKIMKVLSRWYDAEVLFINKDIENMHFTGILDKEQTIEEILFSIYNTNNVKYDINDKTIIFR
ncbi:FecR family protein [Seonamhaeicola maritimus]|uniref:FecR family protein n=1 Tax=Seonamhaeicola maritimus TaxID=2591822 RepID=UPI002493D55F|nr:FecR domain-containing protein [Seonamhaeicola maritimus]